MNAINVCPNRLFKLTDDSLDRQYLSMSSARNLTRSSSKMGQELHDEALDCPSDMIAICATTLCCNAHFRA